MIEQTSIPGGDDPPFKISLPRAFHHPPAPLPPSLTLASPTRSRAGVPCSPQGDEKCPITDPGKPLAQQTAAQVGQEKTRRAGFDLDSSPEIKCLNLEC